VQGTCCNRVLFAQSLSLSLLFFANYSSHPFVFFLYNFQSFMSAFYRCQIHDQTDGMALLFKPTTCLPSLQVHSFSLSHSFSSFFSFFCRTFSFSHFICDGILYLPPFPPPVLQQNIDDLPFSPSNYRLRTQCTTSVRVHPSPLLSSPPPHPMWRLSSLRNTLRFLFSPPTLSLPSPL
jgi:hypothetical protein